MLTSEYEGDGAKHRIVEFVADDRLSMALHAAPEQKALTGMPQLLRPPTPSPIIR